MTALLGSLGQHACCESLRDGTVRDGTVRDEPPRSAVDEFGDWHDRSGPAAVGARYSTLIPAAPLRSGEQYRFEVDLDACSGCKACVSACHSLNGLEGAEIWRSVGLLVGGGGVAEPVWQQNVTTACHHCADPACLAGCPVEAYEKDPVTGIVAHLDDQCIGCRYCQLTCPYEVPTFSKRLGIVRKCDMCSDRLAEGEAPACVQGCPTDAISIGTVSTDSLRSGAVADPLGAPVRLVPTAPASSLTAPSTLYKTSKAMPELVVAADDHRILPASNHPPLVAMLVLTQLSVGALAVSQCTNQLADSSGGSAPAVVLALLAAGCAIGASVLHLGRPLVAWRAVLGLRHSWLSREIVAFGAYGGATVGASASEAGLVPRAFAPYFAGAAVAIGIVGVACSAQLYAVTGRAWWRLDRTLLRFAAVCVATGGAAVGTTTAVAARVDAAAAPQLSTWWWAVVATPVAVTVSGFGVLVGRHRGRSGQLGRSVWLLTHTLRRSAAVGIGLAATGVVLAVVASSAAVGSEAAIAAWSLSLVALLGASWSERTLFFTAAAPDRMPGGFH